MDMKNFLYYILSKFFILYIIINCDFEIISNDLNDQLHGIELLNKIYLFEICL